MANSKPGFQEVVQRQLQNPNCHYLSIATHGSEQGIELFNDDGISRTVIRNLLKKRKKDRNLVGLHLGCCSFLDLQLAEFFYKEDISPWWIAGYGEDVNWIDSTSLDFLFFNKLLEAKSPFLNPIKTIRAVATELELECPGLIRKLGFQIFTGEPGEFVHQLI